MNAKTFISKGLLMLLLAVPVQLEAQSFLKGLKDAVAKEVKDTKESVSSKFGGNKSNNSSSSSEKALNKNTVKYSPVPPSKANDARSLLNELPPFLPAEAVARYNDAEINHFRDQLFAAERRISQLMDINQANEEEDEKRSRANILKGQPQVQAPTQPQAAGPGSQMDEKALKALEDAANNQELQASLESNMEKLDALGEEAEMLEKKIEKGKATQADKKRYEDLCAQMQAITNDMSSSMSAAGIDMNSLMAMAQEQESAMQNIRAQQQASQQPMSMESFYKIQYDKDFAAFGQKLSDIINKKESIREGSGQSGAVLNKVNSAFRAAWNETDPTKVRPVYTNAEKMMEDFYVYVAQARIDSYKPLYDEAVALLAEAEKFAADFPAEESYIERYKVLNAPLKVVGVCIELLTDALAGKDEKSREEIHFLKKSKIKLPLMPGDMLMTAESSAYGMLDDAIIKDFLSGGVKSEDTLEKDFLSNVTFLIYNEKDRCFYKLERGSRTKLGSQYNKSYDFYKRYERKRAVEVDIPVKNLDKAEVQYKSNDELFISIGGVERYFWPVAVQRTEDWLSFIIAEEDGFTKCMFRL